MKDDIWNGLVALVFNAEAISFGLSCMLFGVIVTILDVLSYYMSENDLKKSWLGIKYRNLLVILSGILIWAIGSGLVGYVASLCNVIETSKASLLLVSIGWPYLFRRIISNSLNEVEKQPEV